MSLQAINESEWIVVYSEAADVSFDIFPTENIALAFATSILAHDGDVVLLKVAKVEWTL